MKLSIIIPAYNVSRYLDKCLETCFNQDLPENDYEVIVVNDGSDDNTLEIAMHWKDLHGNMRVITQENQGLSMARNNGLKEAKGEYIMFLDSDDWIAENCLRSITDRCLSDRLDMLRFCAARMINDRQCRMYSYKGYDTIIPGRDLLKTKFFVCVPFAVYRKEFLSSHALSFYPGIYHEDNEFSPRAYYHAERVGSIDDIIYCLRQTPGSITHTVNPKKVKDLYTVAQKLKTFAEEIAQPEYKATIYRQAADCINSCFRELNRMDNETLTPLFSDLYAARKELVGYFLKSSSFKHKIEGILIGACPEMMLKIHRLLDLVHYKERQKQKGIA
jgi:glycosyltransferase involved in cell wall biosynthesis